jgi:hypothetical protein
MSILMHMLIDDGNDGDADTDNDTDDDDHDDDEDHDVAGMLEKPGLPPSIPTPY